METERELLFLVRFLLRLDDDCLRHCPYLQLDHPLRHARSLPVHGSAPPGGLFLIADLLPKGGGLERPAHLNSYEYGPVVCDPLPDVHDGLFHHQAVR